MKNPYPVLLAAVLLLSAPAWAQKKVLGGSVRPQAVQPARTATPAKTADRTDFDAKRVTLTLNNVPAQLALTQLLDASGFSYEFDRAFYSDVLTAPIVSSNGQVILPDGSLDLPPRWITLKLVNATVPNALTSVCKALGVSWQRTAGDGPGDVPVIRIVRSEETVTRADLLRKEAISNRGGGGFGGGGFGGAGGGMDERIRLLDRALTPVSVNVTDKPVRGVLVDVFKAGEIEYVFDEDIATAKNVTVVLKDVSVRTALDALCESAGVGWTVENPRDPRNPGPGPVRIRVGKGYASKTP